MLRVYIILGNCALFCVLFMQSIMHPSKRKMLYGYIQWRLSLLRQESVAWDRAEKFTVILDSYKRPWNMQSIVLTMLRCAFVEKIIVTNNNPNVHIANYVTVKNPKLTLIDQSIHCGADMRYKIASQESSTYFLSVDDDIFLRPSQLAMMADELCKNPTVPHGMYGTRIKSTGNDIILMKGLWGFNGHVDIIQRAYFFTKEHALRFQRIVDQAIYTSLMTKNDPPVYEDILLSVSGHGKPICHDVGPFADCFTSTLKGIALYKTDGLAKKREQFLLQLQRSNELLKTCTTT